MSDDKTDVNISLKSVILDYPIYGTGFNLFSRKLVSIATAGKISSNQNCQYVRALDNISLNFIPGDSIALIGGNGAGKTTLLKLLAGIFYPTSGKVNVSGNVATLLGTGFGLDENATGYENILLGGIVLGISRSIMRSKIEEIEDFTDLGEFLNLPLRTYSAGMRARLAFAISTSINPDILIVDEGLAVGDHSFYDKANKRFEEFLGKSSILVFASHSSELVKRFCNKSIVMNHGRIEFQGSIDDGLDYYSQNIIDRRNTMV